MFSLTISSCLLFSLEPLLNIDHSYFKLLPDNSKICVISEPSSDAYCVSLDSACLIMFCPKLVMLYQVLGTKVIRPLVWGLCQPG